MGLHDELLAPNIIWGYNMDQAQCLTCIIPFILKNYHKAGIILQMLETKAK